MKSASATFTSPVITIFSILSLLGLNACSPESARNGNSEDTIVFFDGDNPQPSRDRDNNDSLVPDRTESAPIFNEEDRGPKILICNIVEMVGTVMEVPERTRNFYINPRRNAYEVDETFAIGAQCPIDGDLDGNGIWDGIETNLDPQNPGQPGNNNASDGLLDPSGPNNPNLGDNELEPRDPMAPSGQASDSELPSIDPQNEGGSGGGGQRTHPPTSESVGSA